MMNLFTSDTLRLVQKYNEKKNFSHRQVLEKLTIIAFRNNGSLPNEFDISLKLPNADTVKDVLVDLGYPHVRDINCFSDTVYIRIARE